MFMQMDPSILGGNELVIRKLREGPGKTAARRLPSSSRLVLPGHPPAFPALARRASVVLFQVSTPMGLRTRKSHVLF
jgi:hypothetical protein